MPPAQALLAVEELTWGEVPVFRMLMSARFRYGERFPVHEPVIGWFHDTGFATVLRTSSNLVLGLAQPANGASASVRLADLVAFRDFAQPGHLKIAVEFRCGSDRLATETRVVATDDRSRRVFAVYWTGIRLFSGLIRREWLRAIRRRAARAAPLAP